MRPMANEDNGHWSASVVLKQHANVEQDLFTSSKTSKTYIATSMNSTKTSSRTFNKSYSSYTSTTSSASSRSL